MQIASTAHNFLESGGQNVLSKNFQGVVTPIDPVQTPATGIMTLVKGHGQKIGESQ